MELGSMIVGFFIVCILLIVALGLLFVLIFPAIVFLLSGNFVVSPNDNDKVPSNKKEYDEDEDVDIYG